MGSNSAKVVLGAALLLTAACGGSPSESATRLRSEPAKTLDDDLGGAARSSDQQQDRGAATEGEDEPSEPSELRWANPSAILVAMGAPVEVTVPDGVTIESVSTFIARDESRREVLTVGVTVSADLAPDELACLLQDQPPIAAGPPNDLNRIDCSQPDADQLDAGQPEADQLDATRSPTVVHGPPTAPLPTYDSFYDWDSPVTSIAFPGADDQPGSPTVAVTTMQARRQSQDAGDNIIASDLAGPVRDLLAKIPRNSANTSLLTWRPEQPHRISADISLGSLPETAEEVVGWMRTGATPGTFVSDGATASATLTGEPPVRMTWWAGSYRNGGTVSFDYALDEDGRPMANPTIASEPIWTELISWGSRWAFDADGVEDPDWSAVGFDDSDWPSGSAPFVRDEVGATDFPTPEPGTTGWFRGRFELNDPATVERLDLEALVDDGFIVYLNGTEVHRWNLPDGPLTADTLTVERISGDDELVVRGQTDLLTEALVPGENIIAVAVHQGAADSSDLRFDVRLAVTQRPDL